MWCTKFCKFHLCGFGVVLIQKKDVDVISVTKTDFFTSDYVFSYEESNLNFAAAFTAYDNVREQ